MTAEAALRLGQAAARPFRRAGERGRPMIGEDMQRAGYVIASALQARFASAGAD